MQLEPIPSSLWTPPTPITQIPVETRPQLLPLDKLGWKDFERLCLRLIHKEADLEGAQCYGEQGNEQEGIDLFARSRKSDKYHVYQCKKVKGFGAADIRDAVEEFQKGEWLAKSCEFVLCTSEPLESKSRSDALIKQGDLLRPQGVELVTWDQVALSKKLKEAPDLVDDFFGRAWVKHFCGEDAAQALEGKKRLDGAAVQEWRRNLRAFYSSFFNRHDPGLPGDQFAGINADSLAERYVFPDIMTRTESSSAPSADERPAPQNSSQDVDSPSGDELQSVRGRAQVVPVVRRHAFYRWLDGPSRSVVLGDPGSGKSTLLRFIALDLLEDSPRLGDLAARWGNRLPLWIPFGWWTKKLNDSQSDSCSLEELLQSWLSSLSASHLWPFVQQALQDDRLLLLVDGLDEWADEDAARQALLNLQMFLDLRPSVPAILTSRPHGFDRLHMTISGWQRGHLANFTLEQCRQLAFYWFGKWADTRSPSELGVVPALALSNTQEEAELKSQRAAWARKRADEFIAEVEAVPDLRELSRVPLLLCLLIAFRTQNSHLPTGRFDLYDKTVDHLITTHPSHRREASRLKGRSSELKPNELRALLCFLAFKIQCDEPSGVIEDRLARELVVEYLTDPQGRFAMSPRDAHGIADDILDIGDDTTGLLIRKSPLHIGFFHRAFQEFLAATQLSEQDIEDQVSQVGRRCQDPQWHEVLLCLFARSTRPNEMMRFVQAIEPLAASTGTARVIPFDRDVASYESAVLSAHLAFGPSVTPAHILRDIATRTFRRIEEESWLPHRERLLHAALMGLRSTSLRSMVQDRVRLWLPDQMPHGTPFFNSLKSWPSAPFSLNELKADQPPSGRDLSLFQKWQLVREVLWRGLHGEDVSETRAAASTLAKLWQHDTLMGDTLMERAFCAVSPPVRAGALDALLEFFPTHPQIELAVDRARDSLDHELQFSGIVGAIKQGRQTNRDRKRLLRLPSERWGLGHSHFRGDTIAKGMMDGWPGCRKTKRACLWLLREEKNESQRKIIEEIPDGPREITVAGADWEQVRYRHEQRMRLGATRSDHSWTPALVSVLLQGYSQDDQVAAWCATQIEINWRQTKFEEYDRSDFLNQLYGSQWELLAKSFHGHPLVVEATEKWIDGESVWMMGWHGEWALVGRTAKAKAKLLEVKEENGKTSRPHFDVRVLLDGWGMADTEVALALREEAFGPAARASAIAHFLPRIIENPEECRTRLVELLRSSDAIEADTILVGLHRLRELHPPLDDSQKADWEAVEEEIVTLALRRRRRDFSERLTHDPSLELIAHFSHNPRVRAIAEEEVRANAQVAIVTREYPEQDLAVCALRCCASPLPVSLRRIIAHQIAEGSGDEAFDLSLLRQYGRDFDDHVSVEMAVGFYQRLKEGATVTQLGLDDEAVYALNAQFAGDTRMPDAAHLAQFQAVMRQGASEVLKGHMNHRRVAAMQWTAPPYAAALVFDPSIIRDYKEHDHIYWHDHHREANAPLAKTLLNHWEEHCAIWQNPAAITHYPGRQSTFEEKKFWNGLVPFIESYPQARQQFLDWARAHTFSFGDEDLLQGLAAMTPDSALFKENCLKMLGHRTIAPTLLAQHFAGDEDVLQRLTHRDDGRPKEGFSGSEIIALCEGWPDTEVLDRLLKSVRRWDEDPPAEIEMSFDLSRWAAYFTFAALKGNAKAIFGHVMPLLCQYPLPVKYDWDFDGAHIVRVLKQRVRKDEALAAMFWTKLQATNNPSAKIVLPSLLLDSLSYREEVRVWCNEEIGRQLDGDLPPEIGFDWKSFSPRPVAHCLLDLLSR